MNQRRVGPQKNCGRCSRPLSPFGRCRRRTCPGYRDLWAGDWQQVVLRNLLEVDHVALITITAPGADAGLPWDRDHCQHDGPCSGRKGCRVLPAAAEAWNRTAPARRAQLHRAASERVRRRYGGGPIIAAKATEFQKRGVLHYHLVVDYTPGPKRARIDAYTRALKELAPLYLFGFVDLAKAFDGRGGVRAAAYCAKYIGKATGESMTDNRPMYVGRHLTARTGITMRWCRYKRYAHYLHRHLPLPGVELTAHALLRGASLQWIIDVNDGIREGDFTDYLPNAPPSLPSPLPAS
jgi:hypothetical protein